ncbi:MAG TPA: hypothetical protein VF013_03855 [Candidatus Limnocylindria bacterium]
MIDRRSLALLAFGGVALLAGLTGSLVLLGFRLPSATSHLAASHGLLMALGFLGTMIALERAVALGSPLAFLAPLATGAGAILLVLGVARPLAGSLFLLGGLGLVAIYVAFDRIQATLHTRVQAVAAVAWPVAALLWLLGRPVSQVVPWLAAFLVLTIAGERLELARLGRLSDEARRSFLAVGAILGTGIVLSLASPDAGVRLAGIGLVGLALWLARHDVARRTVRGSGVTRFIAICLLLGYAWLAVGGIAWVALGAVAGGPGYDAALHTIFLGFVISMVFGHAPVIVPAVLRAPLPYRPAFYLHLGLLHAGLLLRVGGGDLAAAPALRQAGGVLNVVALLAFVLASAAAVGRGLLVRSREVRARSSAAT